MSGPPAAIWNDPTALSTFYNNTAVPLQIQPSGLVISILVAIFGSYATLLLLGRRTASRGWRNHVFLALAATCFSAVAIWGMHFTSMVSVRLLPSPSQTWYVRFNPGMTVLSLFVPLLAVTLAFWFCGSEEDFKLWRVVFSGIIVGLTVGLMHYSASFQLPNYDVHYTAVTVIFAIVLAAVAATVALIAFFRFRAQWADSFWKRCLCTLVLAAAVCGMHYLGLGGTSYTTKTDANADDLGSYAGQSRSLLIAIGVMCIAIIVVSIAFAVFDWWTRREIRKQARNIVIASAAFDKTGKLLVKNDGTLPMQRVLRELDPRQSTFQWLYQLSFNWSIVTPFVPRILMAIAARQKGRSTEPTPDRSMPRANWESLMFRSRFVEASVLLAQQLDLSVESLGVMFDRVLTTGTRVPGPEDPQEKASDDLKSDDESSIHGITLRLHASEGVMLFLVREIGDGLPSAVDYPKADKSRLPVTDSVEHYTQRGYRMAETRFFSKALADHMGVAKPEMDVFLSACKTYAKRGTRPVVQSGGAYIGLYGVRPTGQVDGGVDVLVYNFARHQIPAYRLPDVSYPLGAGMRAWIRECSNLSMGELLSRCNDAVAKAESSDAGSMTGSEDETLYEFQAAIAVAIEALTTALRCWPSLVHLARLSPEILEVPASDHDDKAPAQMIVLEAILPAPEAKLTPVQSRASGVQAPALNSGRHESDKPPAPFVYTPYSLFTKSQVMLTRAKGFIDYSRNTTSELVRVYPLITDVADELALQDHAEKGLVGTTPAGFSETSPNTRWATRASKLSKNLMVDVVGASGHGRRPSNANTLNSPTTEEYEDEKRFGSAGPSPVMTNTVSLGTPYAHPSRKRPGTSDSVAPPTQTRGRLTRDTGAVGSSENIVSSNEVGAPVYSSVRARTDGWFARSMRALERSEAGQALDGVDWQDRAAT